MKHLAMAILWLVIIGAVATYSTTEVLHWMLAMQVSAGIATTCVMLVMGVFVVIGAVPLIMVLEGRKR